MKIMRSPLLVLSCLLAIAVHEIDAEEPTCKKEDSLIDCENKVNAELGEVLAKVSDEVSEDLAQEIRNRVPPEVALAILGERPDTNFADRWGISVENRGLDNDEQALAISRLISSSTKIEVLVRKVEIYEKILDEIPEESRETRGKQLAKKLTDIDNLLVSLAWQPTTATLGRQQEDNQQLFSALWDDAVGIAALRSSKLSTEMDAATEAFSLCVQATGRAESSDFDKIKMGTLFGADFERCRPIVEDHYGLKGKRALENGIRFGTVGESFSSLINGQPQLVFTAATSIRDELVGPEEQKVKISYDFGNIGGRSINGLRRHCRNQVTLACYGEYLGRVREDNAGSFTISVTWTRNPHWDFSLPDDGVDLDTATEEKAVATLSYDYPLKRKPNKDGSETVLSKIVVNGSYEQWISDSKKSDRGLLEATFIHRVSEGTSASFGLVWANQPEFLEDLDLDHQFTAKVGLNFRVGKAD